MKYPFIGEAKLTGAKVLFFTAGCGTVLDGETYEIGNYNERFSMPAFIDITHEYLQNTYGEVQSPEHAEFIIELAELHGIKRAPTSPIKTINAFAFKGGNLYLYGLGLDELTQLPTRKITIPLPPKVEPKIYKQENPGKAPKHFDCVCNKCGGKCCTGQCDDWLCVGSIVTWGNKSVKGEVKALSDGLAWIKNEYSNYCSEYVSSLQKPKTPEEELRDELHSEFEELINMDASINAFVDMITTKYSITKKPQ